MYTDPWGLAPDTVTFADEDARTMTEKCVRQSTLCAGLFAALDGHSSKWVIRTGNLPSPNSGLTETNAVSNKVFGGRITIDAANFDATANRLKVPVNSTVVVTHELGHAVGNIAIANNGSLSENNNCDEDCAIQFENAARKALGIARRRF